MSKNRTLAALTALMLCSGCKTDTAKTLHAVHVWERTGCAFRLNANVGDTMFVSRVPDLDRPGCNAQRFAKVTP